MGNQVFFYVVGPAGSGKSALARWLSDQGFSCWDEDEPGVGAPYEIASNHVVRVPVAADRDEDWFNRHEWRVLETAKRAFELASRFQPVILCGNVLSDQDLIRLRATVIYLEVSSDELKCRLGRRQDNDYGKSDAEWQRIQLQDIELKKRFRARSVDIDADQSLVKVAENVIGVVRTTS